MSLPATPARFICFEGIDGSGKSTCLQPALDYLHSLGFEAKRTREPGGSQLAEQIRALLMHEHSESLDPVTELLLIFAARRQHYTQFIAPQLAQGCWIISDRFVDSSYCYQGLQHSIERIDYLRQMCLAGFKPHLSFIFDLPIDIARSRAGGSQRDRMEAVYWQQLEQIRQCYLELANNQPDYHVIDATQAPEQIHQQVIKRIAQQFDLTRLDS